MNCPKCGADNAVDAVYCCKCGAMIGDQGEESVTITFSPGDVEVEPEAEIRVVPDKELVPGAAMLVVKRGPNAGTRFVLTKEVTTAGRHPESDVFLDDITVSRRHAEILREDTAYRIVDMGSLNGTYINKQRVEEAELSSGDEIQIGKFKLIFFSK